jgi:hypothetical protein
MASVIRVHIRAARLPKNDRWIDRPSSPEIEARALRTLIGKNRDSEESLRELISVPLEIEALLQAYEGRIRLKLERSR